MDSANVFKWTPKHIYCIYTHPFSPSYKLQQSLMPANPQRLKSALQTAIMLSRWRMRTISAPCLTRTQLCSDSLLDGSVRHAKPILFAHRRASDKANYSSYQLGLSNQSTIRNKNYFVCSLGCECPRQWSCGNFSGAATHVVQPSGLSLGAILGLTGKGGS